MDGRAALLPLLKLLRDLARALGGPDRKAAIVIAYDVKTCARSLSRGIEGRADALACTPRPLRYPEGLLGGFGAELARVIHTSRGPDVLLEGVTTEQDENGGFIHTFDRQSLPRNGEKQGDGRCSRIAVNGRLAPFGFSSPQPSVRNPMSALESEFGLFKVAWMIGEKKDGRA